MKKTMNDPVSSSNLREVNQSSYVACIIAISINLIIIAEEAIRQNFFL
jgi:hypothetical protein